MIFKKYLCSVLVLVFSMACMNFNIVEAAGYTVVRDDRTIKDPDGMVLCDWYYDLVVLDGNSDAIQNINQDLSREKDEFFYNADVFEETVRNDPNIYAYGGEYKNYATAEITTNSNHILSVKMTKDWYLGGVGYIDYIGSNYNLNTGDVLYLSDLYDMTDKELREYIENKIYQYILNNPNGIDKDAMDKVRNLSLSDFKFYIQNNCTYIFFNTYEIASGATGAVIVKLDSIQKSIGVENIYNNEKNLSIESDKLNEITDSESAVNVFNDVVNGMSGDEITSIKAIDQLAYIAEEAAARSATVRVEDDIIISDESISDAADTVHNVKNDLESILTNNGLRLRSVRGKARIETTKADNISIKKENITKNIDVVEAVTPIGNFEFEPDSVSELSIKSAGTNRIKVDFNKTDSTSKVNIKFTNITADNFNAIADDDGSILVTKYNPVTDELSAKISESGVFTVVENEKSFDDIKDLNADVQAAINNLASKGVINGTSEKEFSPESPITRAEIAALIVRILNVDDPNADGGFTDVSKENWYFGAAGSSRRENIIAGYEDNTFRGTVVIPKVQITSVMARTLKNRLGYYDVSESVLDEFTDKTSIADWAKSDAALATYCNMVIRRTDGKFAPDTEMTRGDAAVVIEKLYDKVW